MIFWPVRTQKIFCFAKAKNNCAGQIETDLMSVYIIRTASFKDSTPRPDVTMIAMEEGNAGKSTETETRRAVIRRARGNTIAGDSICRDSSKNSRRFSIAGLS